MKAYWQSISNQSRLYKWLQIPLDPRTHYNRYHKAQLLQHFLCSSWQHQCCQPSQKHENGRQKQRDNKMNVNHLPEDQISHNSPKSSRGFKQTNSSRPRWRAPYTTKLTTLWECVFVHYLRFVGNSSTNKTSIAVQPATLTAPKIEDMSIGPYTFCVNRANANTEPLESTMDIAADKKT